MTTAMPEYDSGYADVNGAKLYYEIAGAGAPLILVHGFSLDRRMWDDQFATLAADYRVIRYDVRGFGNSAEASATPYSYPDDLLGLMNVLDIESAHMVGLSMGGAIAVDFATEHPERVRSLVPVDAPLGGFDWITDFPKRMGVAAAVANEAGMDAALKLWLEDELLVPAMNNPACAPALNEIIGGYSGWHWTSGVKGAGRETPTIQSLGAIASPTLVIVGEHDLADFHAMGDAMVEGIDGARKVVMSGVGHMSNMEDPAGFNALLREFLSGTDSAVPTRLPDARP